MFHIRLAAEVAMGKAVMKAASLAGEAIQLLLTHPRGTTTATSLIGAHWGRSGRRQVQLNLPRRTAGAAGGKPLGERPGDGVLAAMLAVGFDGVGTAGGSATPESLGRVAAALADAAPPLTLPVVAGDVLHLAFADPAEASEAAGRIGKAFGPDAPRIAGHYGVARRVENPFRGPPALAGPATGLAPDLLASTPPGAVHVSEDFAAALRGWTHLSADETAYVGDLSRAGETIGLYALAPAGR